jgi:hypothetical protein
MKVGTKSVLFGAHQFATHPWFVAAAWWKLYEAVEPPHDEVTKAPSPKADQLRELGEAKRDRLNARPHRRTQPKLIPYAGKEKGAREDLMGSAHNPGKFPKAKT